MPNWHGPYRVLSVGPEYLDTIQESAENIDSINRVIQQLDVLHQSLSRTVEPEEASRQPASKLRDKSIEKYAVERIVSHVTTIPRPRNLVRQYSYRSKEDTVKATKHLPKHFVDAYWHRKQRHSESTKRNSNDRTHSKGAVNKVE